MTTTRSRPGRGASLADLDSEIVQGLTDLGLTTYEIRVYLAILQHPRSRIPEIARWSKVPQPKVYATVKRLIERGLCESILGPVNRYSVLSPQEAFRPLLDDLKQRHADAKSAITSLKTQFAKAAQPLSRREGRIKVFQGRYAAARNFKFLLAQTEKEVCIVVRLPLVVSDDDDLIRDLVKERGAKVRMLCEVPDGLSDDDASAMDRQKGLGAEIRVTPKVPMRMAVFDGKITALPMVDPSAGEGDGFVMLEVRNESLTQGMVHVFEGLWNEAKKY